MARPGLETPAGAYGIEEPLAFSSAHTQVIDLEIRVGRRANDYSVELTLDRGAGEPLQVFAGGQMPLSILEWASTGDVGRDGRELFEMLFR